MWARMRLGARRSWNGWRRDKPVSYSARRRPLAEAFVPLYWPWREPADSRLWYSTKPHLVDAWGTGFRPEFQSLSGLRAELLDVSPGTARLRTLLLSATMTPETLETLEVLFAWPERLELLSAAQVRPEPAYVVAPLTDEVTRKARIEDALLRLPRPAILYVTKVADAIDWRRRLSALGFSRLAAFHGDTPDVEREATLKRWGTAPWILSWRPPHLVWA